MKIRKAYQGTVPENKILDTYSESQTDTYSCNYVNMFNTYSTTEIRVGTWLGKPLYRKVINIGTLPNNTFKDTAHNISNLNEIIDIRGYAYRSSDDFTVPLPFVFPTSINNCIYLAVVGSNVRVQTGTDRTNFLKSYAVLEYTKTTD